VRGAGETFPEAKGRARGHARRRRAPGLGLGAILGAWLVLLSAGYGQGLELQTGLDATETETKSSTGQITSSLDLEPNYSLTWEGALRHDTNIYVGFSTSGSAESEPQLLSSEASTELDLRAQGQALSLGATFTWNTDSLSVENTGGTRETESSSSNTINLDAELAYPTYPQLSLQYQRGNTSGSGEPATVSTDTLLGINYDWGPWRLWGDQSTQNSNESGTAVSSLQAGVDFDAAPLPDARLIVDESYASTTSGANPTIHSLDSTTTVRVTALPTPFLVMDAEVDANNESSSGAPGAGSSTELTQTLDLRSDPLPQMLLDLSESGVQTSSGGSSTNSQEYTGNLALQVGPSTSFVALASQSRTGGLAGAIGSRQGQEQLSLTTSLTSGLDLQAAYTRLTQSGPGSSYDASSAVLEVSGALSPPVITTADVRRDQESSTVNGMTTSAPSVSLEATAAWSPTAAWNLTLGANLTRTGGTQPGNQLEPEAEIRWSPDLVTTLTARYDLQRITSTSLTPGVPPVSFEGTSSTFMATVTRDLGTQETIELSCESDTGVSSLYDWQRTLELQWYKTW
jgi:hypothetical protein